MSTKRSHKSPSTSSQRQAEEAEEAAESNTQHRADFTVTFFLNQDNTVRETQVTHAQSDLKSGAEDEWEGWQEARLVDFFVQRAPLSLPSDAPVEAAAEPLPQSVVSTEPAPPPAAARPAPVSAAITELAPPPTPVTEPPSPATTAVPTGGFRLQELETVPSRAVNPSWILSVDQPFDVRLTLNLTGIESPQGTPLSYTAAIYAKSLEGFGRRPVGEAQGALTLADKIILNVKGIPLPRGLYSLDAFVNLAVPSLGSEPQPTLFNHLGGKMLQVR